MSEGALQDSIRLALAKEPGLCLWRNNVGTARQKGRDGKVQHVRYGLMPGSADLIGVLSGRFVSMEIKTPTGRVSEDQELWANLVRKFGGFACVARSVEEAKAAIARARSGEAS